MQERLSPRAANVLCLTEPAPTPRASSVGAKSGTGAGCPRRADVQRSVASSRQGIAMLRRLYHLTAILLGLAPAAFAQSEEELAKKLANPVASLISVPFQFNYNQGFADGDGDQYYLNIQPVIPVSISPDWNLISRTILPIYSQDGVIPGEGSQFGLGPTTQSFFFSPKEPTSFGLIWGVGPAFLIPTSTDGIAPNQWGAGITGVALKQSGGWTYGALANHLWSLTGNSRYGDVNQTFLQPFLNYTTPKATSFILNTESTYDWERSQWSVPINALVGQMFKVGNQRVQAAVGARYWADAPDGGPDGWGARFQITLLYPR
jgi:hypothetical protein